MILTEEDLANIAAAKAEQDRHDAEVEAHTKKMNKFLGALCARAINECRTKEELNEIINMLPVGAFHRRELRDYFIKTFKLFGPDEMI